MPTKEEIISLAGDPVAYLKTWSSVGHAVVDRKRVDLTADCEPWLANMFPKVEPLYTADQVLAARKDLEFERDVQKADIAFLNQQLAASHLLIESLWAIIDDIDTYGDIAKSDDKLFRAMVERRQKDRWKTGITTDGYTLSIPTDTTALDAMIQRASEVMRERCWQTAQPNDSYQDEWFKAKADSCARIRALPSVTLADLTPLTSPSELKQEREHQTRHGGYSEDEI